MEFFLLRISVSSNILGAKAWTNQIKKKVKRKQLCVCVLNKIKIVFKKSSSVRVFKKCQKKNKKEMKQALKADWIPEKQYKQFLINAYYF